MATGCWELYYLRSRSLKCFLSSNYRFINVVEICSVKFKSIFNEYKTTFNIWLLWSQSSFYIRWQS